jgi:hypothetical protein
MSLLTLAAAIALTFALPLHAAPKSQSPVISRGQDGRLVYDADEHGNRVPDFSHCGYAGGDRAIPDAPIRVIVAPVPGDSTRRIQQAIDYVAGLPPDASGVRGAVLLLKGRHEISGGLLINASGVVLRGQGMGKDGTILFAAGLDRRTLIRVAGRNDCVTQKNSSWQIKDDYVPAGATSFHLKDAAGLKPGDTILVTRPSTQTWIERLGATEFGGGIGGGWKPGTRDIVWDRALKSIEVNLVTVDAPITTAMETEFGGGHVETYSWPGRVSHIGVENFRLESAFDASNSQDENHSWCAVTMENAENAWVRQVTFKHFAGSAVALYESCQRVTVQDCLSLAPVSEDGGYRRNTFFTMGQQTLFLRCYAEHGRHDFSVGHCAAGPNAFVQCEARLPLGDSGPIESWASGVLCDNVTIDGQALTLGYRAGSGAAVGWAAANSVLWQCSAAVIRCRNPPTAQNWSFGSWAGFEGDGVWRSSNDFVSPDSLYAGQLEDRLGPDAVARLKLMPRPQDESSNPPLDKAQTLAAASYQPAPQLADYIAAASTRDPIPCEPGDAKRIEDISSRSRRGNEVPSSTPASDQSLLPSPQSSDATSTSAATKPLVITNGWLTCDGKLLIGNSLPVAWWRGNIRPGEAPSFEPALTRFAPGRIGPGFTDDIKELADAMAARGQVALDQHYGLWYERRRDDHERVRRMTGDVWPPFFEQPFARSGQGTAWDGLSKYDLTKFNPWYWSRLREFAGICDERGLMLFNENFFQHNILEAGAHWVDCPWRTANNINETGFPEPPPFAGDKRIFIAEQFYDVTNPVRRELYRHYIRQCLDNFTNNSNVIQFTSDEFTGPLAFVQFWLDTIGDWEHETGRKPFVALSCTKDVQDAILADPQRSKLVDVVQFKYWWLADKGTFAPKGGQNLSPRQFERQWKGGRPNEVNLAQMAAEYRRQNPGQAVINDFNSGTWAYVCAGGSMPNLPQTTDARLLEAIPKMKPWAEGSGTNRWVLREAGKQYLVYSGADAGLDLSGESGLFRVHLVNPKTGKVAPGETMTAGRKVKLPNATILWLAKE